MMNPWNDQISAQIVNHMQRNGVEVVESPFEREWQPGPVSWLILVAWRTLRNWHEQSQVEARQNKRLA